ncbi:MAG: hypothetical protein WA906_00605 [Pacificimonas sp.]
MSFWSAIVLIVLIAVVGGIITNRQKHGKPRAGDPEKAELRREVVELKQRIATLEKIATDRGQRLADRIDALKDETGDEKERND